jgi:hypothetical protein
MADQRHNTPALSEQTLPRGAEERLGLFAPPPDRSDELHDDITLALDALNFERPSQRNLREARSHLTHGLRVLTLCGPIVAPPAPAMPPTMQPPKPATVNPPNLARPTISAVKAGRGASVAKGALSQEVWKDLRERITDALDALGDAPSDLTVDYLSNCNMHLRDALELAIGGLHRAGR